MLMSRATTQLFYNVTYQVNKNNSLA